MEDTTILIITFIIVIGVCIFGFLLTKTNKNKQKRTIKSFQDENMETIHETYEKTIGILKEQIELITEESKSVKRRLSKEIGLNQAEEREESNISTKNLEEHYEIDVNSLSTILKSIKLPFNIDQSKIPELLNNPLIKAKAWEYIKKHRDEAIQMGAIVPIGSVKLPTSTTSTTTTSEIESTEEENGMMKLDINDSKYMA